MLSLRIRIWAQLQRLSLDYYEREMAGRIMTRMTTDVDQFESLIENGLLSALVSIVTFVGVGIALVVINTELGLWTLSVVIPLAVATVVFRQKAARLYSISRERIAIVNADFQESLSGVRESQAFVHEGAAMAQFHRLGRSYLDTRVAAQRLVATYFPFVQFMAAVADAIVLGVGARLIQTGNLTSGALIAFLLYIDLFFSPIQQLSQVFDAWQQTRVSVGRIAELMQLESLTPNPAVPEDPGRLHGDLGLHHVRFSYPVAVNRPGFEGARPVDRRGPKDPRLLQSRDANWRRPPEALRGIDLRIACGRVRCARRRDGRGQVDGHEAAGAFLRSGQRGASRSMGTTSARSISTSTATNSAMCRRRRSCSRARSATTSRMDGPRRLLHRSRRRRMRSARTSSSPASQADTITSSPSAADRSRPVSASSLRWLARSSSTPWCSSSTRRPRTSTS